MKDNAQLQQKTNETAREPRASVRTLVIAPDALSQLANDTAHPRQLEAYAGTVRGHHRDGATQLAAQTTPAFNLTGLPDGLKSGIELLSGTAMDHGASYYDLSKPAQPRAHAYAQAAYQNEHF